jgi:hypothetical protein
MTAPTNRQLRHLRTTLVGRHEELVLQALLRNAGGATLSRISAQCGGSVGMASLALRSLETRGCASYDHGRWHAAHPPVQPRHQFAGRDAVAAARVRRERLDSHDADGAPDAPESKFAPVPAYLTESHD